MRTSKVVLVVGLALLLVGCVPSLQPLFTEADVDFDPALVGAFTDEKGDLTFAFQKLGTNAYRLTVTEQVGDRQLTAGFVVHLVRLRGFWFLDFYPDRPEVGGEFYQLHLIRAHTFGRVWIQGDVVRLGLLDSDWLKKKMDEKSVAIEHQQTEDGILLTAPTTKLQDLMFRYANEEEAFPDPLELHRVKECLEQEGCSRAERAQ